MTCEFCGCKTRKFHHITPTLIDLHWLPIRNRIIFKILLLVYKSLNAKASSYLSDLLSFRRSSYSLRSVSNGDLVEPSSNMRTYGDRSFVVCARRLWNSLPLQYVGVHLLTFLRMPQNLFIGFR